MSSDTRHGLSSRQYLRLPRTVTHASLHTSLKFWHSPPSDASDVWFFPPLPPGKDDILVVPIFLYQDPKSHMELPTPVKSDGRIRHSNWTDRPVPLAALSFWFNTQASTNDGSSRQ